MPPTPPAVADVVERVVGRFDGDGDDIVTLDELLALLDPDGTRAEVAAAAAAALELVDTDDSGGMSVDELGAAVSTLDTDGDGLLEREDHEQGSGPSALAVLLHGRGHGPHGDHGAATVESLADRVMLRFDTDDDGAVTLAELVLVLDRHGRSTAEAEADAADVLALVDTSADQQLSVGEVQAVFAAADADADGLVQWAEFVTLPEDFVVLVGQPHHDPG